MEQKLWGGRFEQAENKQMEDFHSSIHIDARMVEEDIRGSIAHADMLSSQGIIPEADAAAIKEGLLSILEDVRAGKVRFDPAAEDIHMNVEALLIQRIGEAGKRVHTGRSRNDQVALDTRMYLLKGIDGTIAALRGLVRALLATAQLHVGTVMPGYTHLQKAQPVTLAHHLLAYVEMFRRDAGRFEDCRGRCDQMPLGAGALAGSTYPLDRQSVADALGFSAITRNSMDSVGDRDYCIEFVSAAAIAMMHLSRFCEELILWSTDEFGFVTMHDGYSTGSSMMPQKKNPDAAELIRGKTGRVYGDLMTLLTVMKGLPLAYNKDMQEDKEALFDALDTLTGCLAVFTGMFETLTFHPDRMRRAAGRGFTNATDLADYLVKKGVPFRSAHEAVGKAVLHCIHAGVALEELPLEQLRQFSDEIGEDVYDAISLDTCVKGRNLPGGPAPEAVKAAIEEAKAWLESEAK